MKELFLNQLSIVNYRNLTGIDFSLDRNINCFVGNNGVSKTNALDAIYFLAMGKSYSNSITSQNISHQSDFCMIEGVLIKAEKICEFNVISNARAKKRSNEIVRLIKKSQNTLV